MFPWRTFAYGRLLALVFVLERGATAANAYTRFPPTNARNLLRTVCLMRLELLQATKGDGAMTQETLDLRAVAERLDKLEKQNRRLKYAGAAALLLVSTALVMGQAAPVPETIEARMFIVRDADGTARAALTVTELGPSLVLYDADGKLRAELTVMETGPRLHLLDADGTMRAGLAATELGPGLVLYDAHGTMRVVLAGAEEGLGLGLYDAHGNTLFSAP